MSEKNQNRLFSEIENTEELPELFHKTMDKYLSEFNQQTMWGIVYNRFFDTGVKSCWCREVYIPHFIDKKAYFKDWVVAFELEDRFSQRKCFEYLLSSAFFGFESTGVKEASEFYFKKDLDGLNEAEILKLNLIRQAPIRYNPLIYPERLNKKVKEIMEHPSKNP